MTVLENTVLSLVLRLNGADRGELRWRVARFVVPGPHFVPGSASALAQLWLRLCRLDRNAGDSAAGQSAVICFGLVTRCNHLLLMSPPNSPNRTNQKFVSELSNVKRINRILYDKQYFTEFFWRVNFKKMGHTIFPKVSFGLLYNSVGLVCKLEYK